jgi:hypothetical protein
MTPEERQKRFEEIEAELSRIRNGMVVSGDPAELEGELLEELEAIEFEEGEDQFRRRDSD